MHYFYIATIRVFQIINEMYKMHHDLIALKKSEIFTQFSKDARKRIKTIYQNPPSNKNLSNKYQYVIKRQSNRNFTEVSHQIDESLTIPTGLVKAKSKNLTKLPTLNKRSKSTFELRKNEQDKQAFGICNPQHRRFMSPKVRPIFINKKQTFSVPLLKMKEKFIRKNQFQFTFGNGFKI